MAREYVFFVLSMFLSQCCSFTIDEIISDSATDPSSFGMIAASESADGTTTIKYELDILIDLEAYMEMRGNSDDLNKRYRRKAARRLTGRWTNNVVPYEITSAISSSRERDEISQAIEEWSRETCLTFREATSADRNLVFFDNGEGCSSYVGMIGGRQKISLARGCRFKRVIVHEIGHAIGFQHEQSRPDRDGFVEIVPENFPPQLAYNFDKLSTSAVNTYDVGYDYRSIMHYGKTAFSTNRMITVRTKDPAFQDIIGNGQNLSFLDIKLANIMYRCNRGCSTSCPLESFQRADCRCYCDSGNPDNPVELCSSNSTRTVRPPVTSTPSLTTTNAPEGSCSDMNANCEDWARDGHCSRSRDYMQMYCRPSCGLCDSTPSSCEDTGILCESMASLGFCTGFFSDYMKDNCQSSCNFCREAGTMFPSLSIMLYISMILVLLLLMIIIKRYTKVNARADTQGNGGRGIHGFQMTSFFITSLLLTYIM